MTTTAGTEPGPAPHGEIDPDDTMDLLLTPIIDHIRSLKDSRSALLRKLLSMEFQRGYAAGQGGLGVATLRDRVQGETIRLSRPTG